MGAGRWSRLAAIGGIALLGVAALALSQAGETDEFVAERDTTCWPCHVGWPTPLRSMYNILPPDEFVAAPGTTFDYNVRVENPWLAKLTFVQATLDLTDAPSLRFASGQEPIEDDQAGTINPDLTALQEPQSSSVTVVVPAGATSLRMTLSPSDTSPNGPDLVLKVYPQGVATTGTPVATVDDAGPGGAEVLDLPSAADLAPFGSGNWTVVAETTFVGGNSILVPVQPAGFSLQTAIGFETTGLVRQTLSTRDAVDAGGSHLFRWTLDSTGLPGANEQVHLVVNATAYYKHSSANNDNEANFTKEADVNLVALADEVQLTPEGVGRTPTPAIATLSMTRISEVVGYVSAFLLVSSIWSGGMFGKASRRSLNHLFGSAKRRVAFHNFLSYGIMLAAIIHLVLFIIETAYNWRIGLLLGGVGLIAMLLLGVTGAFQVGMIRRWNYGTWRWTHYGLAVAAIVFTLAHMFFDGANLERYVEVVGWDDPLVPDQFEAA